MFALLVWLMDTGCGHDLLGRAKAKFLGVDTTPENDEIVFQSRNGITSTSHTAKCYVEELKETVQPFVLEETPPVLSIGCWCMIIGLMGSYLS